MIENQFWEDGNEIDKRSIVQNCKKAPIFWLFFWDENIKKCGDTFYRNLCQTSSRSKNYGKGLEYPLPHENGTPYFKGKAQKVFLTILNVQFDMQTSPKSCNHMILFVSFSKC